MPVCSSQVHITLEETETVWLLDITPSWVGDADDDAEAVVAANAAYAVREERSKTGERELRANREDGWKKQR